MTALEAAWARINYRTHLAVKAHIAARAARSPEQVETDAVEYAQDVASYDAAVSKGKRS